MPINMNDPNLDFTLEEQLLKAELLRNKELRQPKEALREIGGQIIPWSPGQMLANSMNNISGGWGEKEATEGLRNLSGEQKTRLDALRGQLNPETPVDPNDINAVLAETARRGNIGGQMAQLPMGANEGKMIQQETTKFPQTVYGKAQTQGYNVENATTLNDRNVLAATVAQQNSDKEALRQRGWDLADQTTDQQNALELQNLRNLGGGHMGRNGKMTPQTMSEQVSLLDQNTGDSATILRAIDTLENGGNYDAVTGALNDFTGSIPGYASAKAVLGHPEQKAGLSQIETVKGKVTELAKQAMSKYGKLGNMAVQEWKIISDAVANLDPGAENFPQMLAEIKFRVRNADRYAREDYARNNNIPLEQLGVSDLDTVLAESIKERDALTKGKTSLPKTTNKDSKPTVVRTGMRNGVRVEQLSNGEIRNAK